MKKVKKLYYDLRYAYAVNNVKYVIQENKRFTLN